MLPRLLAELPPGDQSVATWVARRVQHLHAATSRKSQIEIGADVATRVLEWGRREIDATWFSEQLMVDPWVRGLRAPRRARWARLLRDGVQLFPTPLVIAVSAFALRDVVAKN